MDDKHGQLTPIETAIAIAIEIVQPLTAIDDISVHAARGRVLARDLYAPTPMPPFDNSAMDGFAVALADLIGRGPWYLPVAGTIAAGTTAPTQTPGKALRIFTGAPVPPGSDAIVMQESCDDQRDHVLINDLPALGANIRRAGEDIAKDGLLAPAGTLIEGRHIGLLAGTGHTTVPVIRRPRIAVLSTGNELAGAAEGIHDANRPMLLALCEAAGAQVTDLGICPDEMARMTEILAAQAGHFDLIVTSGAASVGGKDFVRPALIAAGGEVEACRVALKPGKPVFFGRLADTLVTGLPGNPLSAYVGFQLFITRQIARMLGMEHSTPMTEKAVAGYEWSGKPGRTEYVAVRKTGRTETGLPILERLGHGSSAALLPLTQADGMAVISAESAQGKRGDVMDWIPFGRSDLTWTIT